MDAVLLAFLWSMTLCSYCLPRQTADSVCLSNVISFLILFFNARFLDTVVVQHFDSILHFVVEEVLHLRGRFVEGFDIVPFENSG